MIYYTRTRLLEVEPRTRLEDRPLPVEDPTLNPSPYKGEGAFIKKIAEHFCSAILQFFVQINVQIFYFSIGRNDHQIHSLARSVTQVADIPEPP
ncbi:MAG: hypothetical protein US50_C0039G0009 [Candidatus Nomurabacteria bacterium GW2011_GWB1_37_5]|uniref:Uncharacterized protein n=1 Tax=Candidatus Nomurabacteria bacterium GW2011_GWB1_37_5 TaxID=1618742 RepID=A0A0G0GUN8_9BACT|nr:MAG: hypothetical protein US50_C0039G0009 [Candidatus Nomurabacteria bacterium GW2011_GWB1_37_5]